MYDKKLETTGLALTSVIYNKNENLQTDDLPLNFRKHYWNIEEKTVKKPINFTRDDLEKLSDIQDPEVIATSLPFLEYEDFGSKLKRTVFDLGISWLVCFVRLIRKLFGSIQPIK